MSFQAKTDYFGLASGGIVITSSEENKSATVIQARNEKGDVVAQEIVGETTAPACNYVLSADSSTGTMKIGEPTAYNSKYYTITGMSISTSAGSPPSLQVSGEEVPSNSHSDCYYQIPTVTIKMCHHAQVLFGVLTNTNNNFGNGCYMTQANYSVSGSLTKATKDGVTVAYDISEGKIEASFTFVSTGGTAPSLTKGSDWEFTSPLTKSEADSDYVQYTCTLTKNLSHATVQSAG